LIAAAGIDQGEGDNKNAVAMAGLRDIIQAKYLRLVSEYGEETENAGMMVSLKSSAQDQLEERRQSISGVSLDEEMANMIKYQHAYQAAARMITTVDEMLDTVINRMGLVGR
jgi:flagellar hook-associated protein 1 FlgK